MIGLDTNVLVRFLVQDDTRQAAQATRLIGALTATAPGWIGREVMVELVWVLERAYRLPRPDIAAAIDGLLASAELVIEAADRVGLAAERYRQGGPGFADQMIALAARDAGCTAVMTFDRQAALGAGLGAGMTLVDGRD